MLSTSFQNLILFSEMLSSWTETFENFTPSEYKCVLEIQQSTSAPKVIIAEAEGDSFKFETTFPKGEINWVMKITNLAVNQVYDFARGVKTVEGSLTEGTDPRTYWERVYSNLKKAYEKLSLQEVSEISIPLTGSVYKYRDLDALYDAMMNAAAMAGIDQGEYVRIIESYD